MMENLEAMELVNSMTTKQVRRLFEESFECQNILTMSTVIKVLAKRGCYDVIQDVTLSYIKSGHSLQLNSAFAIVLGQSLFDIRNGAPALGYIGKSINKRSSKGESVYDDAALQEDVSNLNDSFSSIKLASKQSYLDLFTIMDSDATEETYKKYLEALTARDVASMKMDTYNAIINGLIRLYMSSDNRIKATQRAIGFVKMSLKPQLEKLLETPDLRSKMQERISTELF
jgi:hypothetical protein